MGSSPTTGLTLASKTKMWLSAHRAEQWCSLGWRLQRLAPLTSLAAVGRRRLCGAKTRLLEPAPRASAVGWRGGCCDCPQRPVRGGCFDGPQRALKRGARYDQATETKARRCHRRTSLAQCAAAMLWGSARERQIWGKALFHLSSKIIAKRRNLFCGDELLPHYHPTGWI